MPHSLNPFALVLCDEASYGEPRRYRPQSRGTRSKSFLDPQSLNAKPEVCDPGTNIDAGGFTFSGTSQATPFVSAIGGDYISGQSALKLKAALMKSTLLAAAGDSISGGTDKIGLGGVDYVTGFSQTGWWWFEGNNSAWATFDSGDLVPGVGVIEEAMNVTAGQTIRLALSWLTRGTWTLSQLSQSHPIGLDLDLLVFDPNGNLVALSDSFDNSFEAVTFVPTMSGNYTYNINKFSNRDTSSNLIIGVTINRN